MSKRKHEETTTTPGLTENPSALFESKAIHDRSSTFIAIFTPSISSPQSLQRHPPFEGAQHKILAWRKPSAQRSLADSFSVSTTADSSLSQGGRGQSLVCETGSDEDGEKYAGKKLEKVLNEMNVVGTVVVARWYGGVMLGPVRFKWIEDSAREAILMWKRSVRGDDVAIGAADGGVVKKVKTDDVGVGAVDDGKEKERLVRVLKERDGSIVILRGLLAEKNLELEKMERNGTSRKESDSEGVGEQSERVSPTVATVPDYVSMPVLKLKQLEKARDATLSWILKQIDVIEVKIKAKAIATHGK